MRPYKWVIIALGVLAGGSAQAQTSGAWTKKCTQTVSLGNSCDFWTYLSGPSGRVKLIMAKTDLIVGFVSLEVPANARLAGMKIGDDSAFSCYLAANAGGFCDFQAPPRAKGMASLMIRQGAKSGAAIQAFTIGHDGVERVFKGSFDGYVNLGGPVE